MTANHFGEEQTHEYFGVGIDCLVSSQHKNRTILIAYRVLYFTNFKHLLQQYQP
jgi:hypothetical protein